ncbi:MAG: ABC transporter ATP-binding protein [Mycobacterium leprae]
MNALMKTEPAPVGQPAEAVVQLEQVTKRYFRTTALADVNLSIPRGSITGLLGLNGSGKSTLLKLIAGLARPTSGQVLVDGRAPGRWTKGRVAYVPEVDHLYPWMTVRESIAFVSSFYPDWERERAEELLAFMALPADQPTGKLSKGMRARLRLVIALAHPATVVLMDEPLSGIDMPSRSRITEAILSQFRAGEQTIIMSTHDLLETETLFDRVILLERGRVHLEGDAETIRAEHGCAIHDLLKEVQA